MAYPPYNGWSGMIREARNGVFFAAIKSGLLNDYPEVCHGCGQKSSVCRISQHSEEYGPLPTDYVASCVPLCFRCHFLVHNRLLIPNRWYRYLNLVAAGDLPAPLPHGNWASANRMLKEGDIAQEYPPVATPNEYLSSLPMQEYSGPMKIATVRIPGSFSSVGVPDPRLYVSVDGVLVERPAKEALANIKVPLSTFLNSPELF